MRSPALLAAVALAGLFAFLAPATAVAAGPAVVVKPLSGPAQSVPLADLGEPDVNGDYAIRDTSGGETSRSVSGHSLETVLRAAGVDVFTFSYLEVSRPGGGAVLLTSHQVRDGGAFPDGPPVVFEDAGGAGFLRPSAGSGDANAADTFSDARLRVRLRSGSLLDVSAKASRTKVQPGDVITFSAQLVRSGAGQSVSYSWTFDDGSGARGAQARHRFEEPGNYDVLVGVTAPGDSVGSSDVVTVRVGKPKRKGPDRRGGGRNKKDDAPDSGRSNDGAGGDGSGGTGGGDGGGSGGADDATGSPDAGDGRPQRERRDERRERRTSPGGEPISGELLEVSEPAVAEEAADEEPSPAARTGDPADSSGFAIPGVAVGLLGLFGLLGTGALVELERLRPGAAAARVRAAMEGWADRWR